MITKNFIKQCEQAEELQAWYRSNVKNVHEGDRYICQCKTCTESMFVNYVKDSDIDYINERDMTDVDPTYAAMVSLSGVGEFGAFWDDEGFIWLPTQERLVKIHFNWYLQRYRGKMIISEYLLYLGEFTEIAEESKYKYYSLKEMMLGYLYQEKYDKLWTGEKWVKIQ